MNNKVKDFFDEKLLGKKQSDQKTSFKFRKHKKASETEYKEDNKTGCRIDMPWMW